MQLTQRRDNHQRLLKGQNKYNPCKGIVGMKTQKTDGFDTVHQSTDAQLGTNQTDAGHE